MKRFWKCRALTRRVAGATNLLESTLNRPGEVIRDAGGAGYFPPRPENGAPGSSVLPSCEGSLFSKPLESAGTVTQSGIKSKREGAASDSAWGPAS